MNTGELYAALQGQIDKNRRYLTQKIEILEKANQGLRDELEQLKANFSTHLDFHALADDDDDGLE